MSGSPPTLLPLIEKLLLWRELGGREREAILALPHKVEQLAPSRYLVREGEQTANFCVLLEGFAFRQKLLVDGTRSISAIHMRGDMVGLQNSLLGVADHSVQTLTQAAVAFIPVEAITSLAFQFPSAGMALWYDTLVDGAIFREWIASVGRRGAGARIAHLLCEFGIRLEAIGLGSRLGYELPITQEQLADATGLTPVHVNRTLSDLEIKGLISRTKRFISIADWPRIAAVAGFSASYLHLPADPRA